MDYNIEPIATTVDSITDYEWDWLDAFARTLRPADRREAEAAHEGSTFMAVVDSVFNSEKAYRVTTWDMKPLVLYGKCAYTGMNGRLIWCLATDALPPYEREFARVSRGILREWAAEHGVLWNCVGDFNEPAKRWLKWCGAEFGEPLEMGGEKFIRFYIRGK